MTVPLVLFGLALGAAILTLLLGARFGSIVLVVGLAIAAYLEASKDSNAFMLIAYTLAFGWPALVGSIALGVVSGANMRKQKYLVAILPLLPFLYFVVATQVKEKQKGSEERLAKDFVVNNKQLILLMGGEVRASQMSSTTFNDSSRGKYDFHISGGNNDGKPVYAIVDVSRKSGHPEFTLSCVTTLSMGQRDAGKSDCDQSVLTLPTWDPASEAQQGVMKRIAQESSKCEIPAFFPSPNAYSVQAVLVDKGRPTGYQIDESGHEGTQVDIVVNSPTEPVVLLLGASSPNIWNIAWSQGTRILAVVAGDSHRQIVTGLSKDVPVLMLSSTDPQACKDHRIVRYNTSSLDVLSRRHFARAIDAKVPAVDGKVSIGPPLVPGIQPMSFAGTLPSDYFDKSAPRAGESGLQDALAKGEIRRATKADANAWYEASNPTWQHTKGGDNIARLEATTFLPNQYVVLGPFVYPSGLRELSVRFFIPKGVPKPSGVASMVSVYDFNTLP